MNLLDCVATWIEPLRPALPQLTEAHLDYLHTLEADLATLLVDAPAVHTPAGLLAVRRSLAVTGPRPDDLGAGPVAALVDTLAGFVCGFHDLDLRDATGPGHGRMILRHGTLSTQERWAARLAAGELVGIAATERHGGSRLQEITTRAVAHPRGGWRLFGQKCWVSRLGEASGFVVFFKNPDGQITAAVVDADTPGLERGPVTPAGLGGWTWGSLSLTDVAISPDDLVGGDGDGLTVFREHFARFRPLVAAIASGTAAGVHSSVRATLRGRLTTGILPRLRDTALVTLGRTCIEINAALLSALASAQITAGGGSDADLWSRTVKAHAVDTAHRAVQDLALLVGAQGFQAASPLAKARADLGGLLMADGIHDSLLRSAGRILSAPPAVRPAVRLPAVLAA